jgi:hypothetical protein
MPLPLIPIAIGAAAGVVGSKIVDAIGSRYVVTTPKRKVVDLDDYYFEDSEGDLMEFRDLSVKEQNEVLLGIAKGHYDL